MRGVPIGCLGLITTLIVITTTISCAEPPPFGLTLGAAVW